MQQVFFNKFKNLILYDTKYGFFIRTLSDDAVSENIRSIKIRNFEIIRKRIDTGESTIIGITTAMWGGAPLYPLNNDMASIGEIISNEDSVRTFFLQIKQSLKTMLVNTNIK